MSRILQCLLYNKSPIKSNKNPSTFLIFLQKRRFFYEKFCDLQISRQISEETDSLSRAKSFPASPSAFVPALRKHGKIRLLFGLCTAARDARAAHRTGKQEEVKRRGCRKFFPNLRQPRVLYDKFLFVALRSTPMNGQ